MLSIRVDGDLTVAASFERSAVVAPAKTFAVTRKWGLIAQARIQANASGRPGPNVVTGDYRRSWSTLMTMRGFTAVADIGTNAPQGRRLEYGFVGVDALGRHYAQPAFPHVRPALPIVEAGFVADLGRLIADV